VVSTQAFIIGSGPMAMTRSGLSFSQISFSAAVTKPGLPYEPSSVQTTRSSQYFPYLFVILFDQFLHIL
jgi:hypothetical protein